MEILSCPVCKEKLNRINNTYKCLNNHSYDISSFNYTNLLLANQHHSFISGDSKEMILARKDFLSLGYYHILRKTILDIIFKYHLSDDLTFLDIACGEGYYTNYLHQKLALKKKIKTIGIDISKAAIIEACKKVRLDNLTNIDYFICNLSNLPFFNASFDFMLNCFAPISASEFYRVLKTNGYFIRVLPDVNHLYDLKKVLYKDVILNVPKKEDLEGFELVEHLHINDIMHLKNKDEILSLFKMTPYYYKSSLDSLNKLTSLDSLDCQIAFNVLVYKKI